MPYIEIKMLQGGSNTNSDIDFMRYTDTHAVQCIVRSRGSMDGCFYILVPFILRIKCMAQQQNDMKRKEKRMSLRLTFLSVAFPNT